MPATTTSSMGSSAFLPMAVPQPTTSILDLPTEIRLRIFEYLYEEITVHITEPSPASSFSVISKVSPGPELLLTCRKIYEEAKPYNNAASVNVTGNERGSILSGRNFPARGLRRVQSLSVSCPLHHRYPYDTGSYADPSQVYWLALLWFIDVRTNSRLQFPPQRCLP